MNGLSDSNPSTWHEARVAYYEAAVRDIAGDLARLHDRERFFEAEHDQLALAATREFVGLLRERASTLADKARDLRAQAADNERSPSMPMSVTTRRIRRAS